MDTTQTINCAELVATAVKEEGVEHFFGIGGGHIWLMIDRICFKDISMIHMRHEQAAVYAADAYARSSGKVGLCFGTAGPGMLNMVTGISQAHLARSPVVALFGRHMTTEDGRGQPWQAGQATDVMASVTKWTQLVTAPSMAHFWVKKAFRDAMTYPPGPVGLEFPMDILGQDVEASSVVPFKADARKSIPAEPGANPALVERIVDMVLRAERPVIVAGDGVYWAKAAAALKEFAELAQVPVHTRRLARGIFPETHPLAFRGSRLTRNADLILIMGLRLGMIDQYGEWGDQAKHIQINESPEEICLSMSTEMEVIANPRVVLEQMIDCAKNILKENPQRTEWLKILSEGKERQRQVLAERVNKRRGNKLIHPETMGQEIGEFLDRDATVIYDSFTASTYLSDKITAATGGTSLDTAAQGGVGHSIGMGIGAQLARPGKQVFAIIGDGGMGVGGMDIETAVKHKLPVCYLVWNNNMWVGAVKKFYYGEHWEALGSKNPHGWDMIPDIRYDQMFALMGAHGEHVTKVEEIKPALERAFNSGKTSVINVVGDPDITSQAFGGDSSDPPRALGPWIISTFNHIPPEKMPELGRRLIHPHLYE